MNKSKEIPSCQECAHIAGANQHAAMLSDMDTELAKAARSSRA
jgi:hypothetical protein